MIKIFNVESSAVLRSIKKQIILSNSNLELCGDSAAFSDVLPYVHKKAIDAVLADSSAANLEALIANLSDSMERIKCPVIVLSNKAVAGLEQFKNVFVMNVPDLIIAKQSKLTEIAALLEKKILEMKSNILYGRLDTPAIVRPCTRQTDDDLIPTGEKPDYKALLVGVSTGGPGTIQHLLESIGKDFPLPILITQHIDTSFEKNLTAWLDNTVPLTVHLAKDNTYPEKGHVYFAPADFHMVVCKDSNGKLMIKLNKEPPVNFLRPSVDVLFKSAARVLKQDTLAVLLTGMGSDGAEGCCDIRKMGGYTIGESEESCVIYGMPKAAHDMGGTIEEVPLPKIADRIRQIIGVK